MRDGNPAASAGADPTAPATSVSQLISDVRAALPTGVRRMLGIVGAPGSGKSTLAETMARTLGHDAVLVSMDGFHLAGAELRRLGREARKGAPDTFDAAGYVNLLRRLRARDEPVVYAPVFDRAIEEPINCAVPVSAEVPLVITEGNYLLIDAAPWHSVRELLDECWYLDPGDDVRIGRLVARHMAFGRTAEQAYGRSHGSDQRNAELIAASRGRASRVVRVPDLGSGAPG